MRVPRLYQPSELALGKEIQLNDAAIHHAIRVLRLSVGDAIIVFNGEGGEYLGEISHVHKQRHVTVTLKKHHEHDIGSELNLHLGQVISRGERMDFTIQKAIELGVSHITPLFSERCEVKLTGDRLEKKMAHWQTILINACEQSGRTRVPTLHAAQELTEWAETNTSTLKLTLDPFADYTLKTVATHPQFPSQPQQHTVALLIGAEGGLTDREIKHAQQAGFIGLRLGPRILRTETASLAAITALQCWLGDMG